MGTNKLRTLPPRPCEGCGLMFQPRTWGHRVPRFCSQRCAGLHCAGNGHGVEPTPEEIKRLCEELRRVRPRNSCYHEPLPEPWTPPDVRMFKRSKFGWAGARA